MDNFDIVQVDKRNRCFLRYLIFDPRGRPTGSDHCFLGYCPYVRTSVQNIAKQIKFEAKTMLVAGVNVDLGKCMTPFLYFVIPDGLEEDPISQSWIAITPYDEENLLHFSNLVKPRSLIEDGKFWKSVYHKFDFYADLLANLYEVKSGNQRDGKKYLDVLPISVLKQKLARSAGKMLRFV